MIMKVAIADSSGFDGGEGVGYGESVGNDEGVGDENDVGEGVTEGADGG